MDKGKQAMENMRKMKIPKGGPAGPLLTGALGVGLVAFAGYNSLFNVEGGHRAVMYNRIVGIKETIYGEGTHFMIPWVERPVVYDVRTRPRNIQSLTGSRDLQMVNITLRVLSRPETAQLPWIYRRLGKDFDERVLPSIVNEVLKQVVAQFNAAQLITQREHVSRLVRRNLMDRAQDFNIILEDVAITHLSFGREYTAAVEAKQVAQQEAERAKYTVDKALQDKKSTVIKAQGEARSAHLVGEALKNNPGFLELRRISTARDISQTVSHSANRIYLDADSLLLNLLKESGTRERMSKKY